MFFLFFFDFLFFFSSFSNFSFFFRSFSAWRISCFSVFFGSSSDIFFKLTTKRTKTTFKSLILGCCCCSSLSLSSEFFFFFFSRKRFVVISAAIFRGRQGRVFRVYKSVDFFYEGERCVQTSFIGYTTESVKHTLLNSLSLSLEIFLSRSAKSYEIRRWTLCSRLLLFRLSSSPRRRLFWRWTRPPPPWPWPSSPPA